MVIYIKNLQRSAKLHPRKIKRDLAKALRLLGLSQTELSILFVNSERMRRLNHLYRGVDKATDVLSFPLSHKIPAGQEGRQCCMPLPLGDIVICAPKAILQAQEYGVSVSCEIQRLLVHGLLHLLGYDHEVGAYQKKKMEKEERRLLNALKTVA